jgi:hypothetical protein
MIIIGFLQSSCFLMKTLGGASSLIGFIPCDAQKGFYHQLGS